MNVSVVNRSDGNVEIPVLNSTLGAVVYENEGTTIAYQGGGVWKRSSNGGSTMISPPEFHYRTRLGENPTLTLPLVVVRGDGTISEQAVVESAGTTAKYPLDDPGHSNPLESGEVTVTVQSEYYQAWGAFFEERTEGNVGYDHGRERATVTLLIPEPAPRIEGGIVSGSASGNDLQI